MKNSLLLFIKGAFIGMSSIIPGVSGSTVAILLDIYDQMIYASTQLALKIKKGTWRDAATEIQTLIPIALGVVIGLLLFSRLIAMLLVSNPTMTQLLFTGLIIGSIPSFLKKTSFFPINKRKGSAFILGSLIMIAILWLDKTSHHLEVIQEVPDMDLFYIARILPIGFIVAIAAALPGISGSLILLLFGEYQAILSILNLFISYLIAGEILWFNFFILASFSIGLLSGLLCYALLVVKFLATSADLLFSFAFGLIIFSIVTIWPTEFYFSLNHIATLMVAIALPLLLQQIANKKS